MRDQLVEVRPAVDLSQLRRRWAELDAREARTLAEIRLERGRLLVEARKAFPARGPRAAGWGSLLQEWKVDERTARRYMALAGHVDEEVSDTLSETSVPTYRQAGVVHEPSRQQQHERYPAPGGQPTLAGRAQPQLRVALKQDEDEGLPPAADHGPTSAKRGAKETSLRLCSVYRDVASQLDKVHDAGFRLVDLVDHPAEYEEVNLVLRLLVQTCLDELTLANTELERKKSKRAQLSVVKGGT